MNSNTHAVSWSCFSDLVTVGASRPQCGGQTWKWLTKVNQSQLSKAAVEILCAFDDHTSPARLYNHPEFVNESFHNEEKNTNPRVKASYTAFMGSGSASRLRFNHSAQVAFSCA